MRANPFRWPSLMAVQSLSESLDRGVEAYAPLFRISAFERDAMAQRRRTNPSRRASASIRPAPLTAGSPLPSSLPPQPPPYAVRPRSHPLSR
jgi:hypothetical protein